jgi:hypothetical protein
MLTKNYRGGAVTPVTAPAFAIGLADGNDPLAGANKTERAYADLLDLRIRLGEVSRWWYAPGSLRLAPDLHYRPDFLIQHADRRLEIVDCKGGRKDGTYHFEEDSWVKIKTVAALYPFAVGVAWQTKGSWKHERIGGTGR